MLQVGNSPFIMATRTCVIRAAPPRTDKSRRRPSAGYLLTHGPGPFRVPSYHAAFTTPPRSSPCPILKVIRSVFTCFTRWAGRPRLWGGHLAQPRIGPGEPDRSGQDRRPPLDATAPKLAARERTRLSASVPLKMTLPDRNRIRTRMVRKLLPHWDRHEHDSHDRIIDQHRPES